MKMLGACALSLFAGVASGCAGPLSGQHTLPGRWLDLWGRLEKRGAVGDPAGIYREIAARYSEPHRAYHTLTHVEQVLEELDSARPVAEDVDAVEAALWLHDVVYGVRNHEEESAKFATETLLKAGLPAEWVERVSGLIMATRHDTDPLDADARLVADIDMSILGQPRDRFDAYEAAVRLENVPRTQEGNATRFNQGRAALLKRFLAQPVIYYTDYFRQKYEEQARANLRYSIERLEHPS